eukprot:9039311-Pyramimonas_sp.AAC.2
MVPQEPIKCTRSQRRCAFEPSEAADLTTQERESAGLRVCLPGSATRVYGSACLGAQRGSEAEGNRPATWRPQRGRSHCHPPRRGQPKPSCHAALALPARRAAPPRMPRGATPRPPRLPVPPAGRVMDKEVREGILRGSIGGNRVSPAPPVLQGRER